jgi:hypothetical protein
MCQGSGRSSTSALSKPLGQERRAPDEPPLCRAALSSALWQMAEQCRKEPALGRGRPIARLPEAWMQSWLACQPGGPQELPALAGALGWWCRAAPRRAWRKSLCPPLEATAPIHLPCARQRTPLASLQMACSSSRAAAWVPLRLPRDRAAASAAGWALSRWASSRSAEATLAAEQTAGLPSAALGPARPPIAAG